MRVEVKNVYLSPAIIENNEVRKKLSILVDFNVESEQNLNGSVETDAELCDLIGKTIAESLKNADFREDKVKTSEGWSVIYKG